MPFVAVGPHEADLVQAVWEIEDAARQVDDPTQHPETAEQVRLWIEFGWDLEPGHRFLYVPDGETQPVGLMVLDLPEHDNLHLVDATIVVHPAHRRRGHGSAIMAEVLRRTAELGRTTVWVGRPDDDEGSRIFLEQQGFRFASRDARRRQVLADVDQSAVQRLHAEALERSGDYVVERLDPPYADELLTELIEVTAAINDAPMGTLTYENEVFDLQRVKNVDVAAEGRGDRIHRIVARHRDTGEVGGHTLLLVNPFWPHLGWQGDTAVGRAHRGHRLGVLLKIDMMRWIAEIEPQVIEIETWNNVDNHFMIDVNEALGYRLNRVFSTYERVV